MKTIGFYITIICFALSICTPLCPKMLYAWDNEITHPGITNAAVDYLTLSDSRYSILSDYSNFQDKSNPTQLTFIDEGSVKEDFGCSASYVSIDIPYFLLHGILVCDTNSDPSWILADWGTEQDESVMSFSWGSHGYNPLTGEIWYGTPDWLTGLTRGNALEYSGEIWHQITTNDNGYFHMGRFSHLIEDMASPAHVHADFHGFGDDVETYSKHNYKNISVTNLSTPVTHGLSAQTGLPHPDLNDENSPENFMQNVAWKTYYMTSYYGGVLVTEMEEENIANCNGDEECINGHQPDSELKRMAPLRDGEGNIVGLRYDDGGFWENDHWIINVIGKNFIGFGPGDSEWWNAPNDNGYFYLENIDGDWGGAVNAEENNRENFFTPSEYKIDKFKRVLPNDNLDDILDSNTKSLLDIYTDECSLLAGKWVAGFLKYAHNPIPKALEWLKNQQTAGGYWSTNNGTLGPTAMATLAFLNAGYTEADDVVADGINYILNFANKYGDGGIYEWYGNYDTSLAILALKASKNSDYFDEISDAADYLISIQSGDFDDNLHPWYGGWGYDAFSKNNWSDLSNSQFTAMALDTAGLDKNDFVWTRFQRFLSRVQSLDSVNDMPWANGRNDGGFVYNPEWISPSFGSMTAAGIWSLRLSGVPVNDNRIQNALSWLENHEDLSFNDNPNYQIGNRISYYWMSFAKAMALCFLSQEDQGTWYEDWYDKLRYKIASDQHPDGYWNNYHGAIIDTCFTLLALQTRQPLHKDLWMSIILASPAKLVIYDPQDRMCSIDECNIPGGEFLVDDGKQIVNLTQLEPGHYRFVFIGTGDGTVHLTVNANRGDEVISSESREFEIINKEVLQSDVLVSSLVGALTINVEDPEPPPFIPITIDIYPEDCPNIMDVKSKGQAPLAILGAEGFDVTQIDPDSVHLESVYRKRYNYEDVTGPHECNCGFDCEFPDGNLDMTLKFDRKQIITVIGEVNDDDVIELTLTGNLKSEFGGTPIRGTDTIIIEKD